MVDKSSQIAALCSVDDTIEVDPEQIRGTNTDSFVLRFSDVGQNRSYHLADVFDNHLVGSDRLQSEQTPVVNRGFSKLQLLLSKLKTHLKNH